MGVSFLAPLFLAGLVAIAIPILVHLTHRERRDALAFPSLMFVQHVPYRVVRRQRIKHWLIFLLRSLAVALLALAFARPLLEDSTRAAGAAGGARDVVLLLDRSHSMTYGDRWERALEAARQATVSLTPRDRVTLVGFAERAETLTRPGGDRAAVHAALDAMRPGYRTTRYGPALQLARELIARAERPRQEVLLISDFQRTGWDPQQAPRLPEGTRVTAVDVSETDARNLAVATASIGQNHVDGRHLLNVSARLINRGGTPPDEVMVRLELDGQEVGRRRTGLESDGSATVSFDPVALPDRTVPGAVRLGEDPLMGDNAFHFIASRAEPISVLVVEPPSAAAEHSLYLRRAAEVGSRPGFDVAVRPLSELSPGELENRSVIVLNDAPFPDGRAGRRLEELVSGGAGLLVVLGRYTPPSRWPGGSRAMLPIAFGGPVDRDEASTGRLSQIDYDHPVFRIFRQPRSGEFSGARFFRYRRMENPDSAEVVARFDDGAAALVEGRIGTGRVMVWASDLENFWNDLAVQPVFVPFVDQQLKYLADYVEPRQAYRVGQVLDLHQTSPPLGLTASDSGLELVVVSPEGDRQLLRPSEARYVTLEQAGVYRIRPVEGGGGEESVVAAVNIDPAESDLATIDPEELVGVVAGGASAEGEAVTAAMLSVEERERRQGLWWYLLAVAGVILIAETLLSARAGSRGASVKKR